MPKPIIKRNQIFDYHILVVWPNAHKHITSIKSILDCNKEEGYLLSF